MGNNKPEVDEILNINIIVPIMMIEPFEKQVEGDPALQKSAKTSITEEMINNNER